MDSENKNGPPFRGILEAILLFLQKSQQDLTNRSPNYLQNIAPTSLIPSKTCARYTRAKSTIPTFGISQKKINIYIGAMPVLRPSKLRA